MVHVALRTRQDLLDTPGDSGIWKGIDLAHVEQMIPNSLYFFLRLLFGNINVAHEGIEKDCEIDQTTVCSIAQDIVYGVSNRRKLNPKHVGLGLALHQATRSEALVELFHAANHTIGIDTVRRIDTTIAQNILDRFAKNGYVYIPEKIVNDRMLHWSCDRCARTTTDGKNIFHCTQIMVWQRGPVPQQSQDDSERKNVLRLRAIKPSALQEFQRLDHVHLPSGKIPPPSFCDDNTIEIEWSGSSCYEERQRARAKVMAWMVSRIHNNGDDRSVPPWGALNEATSTVDPPVTPAGMLQILQAPADENDTLTTVINRFVDI